MSAGTKCACKAPLVVLQYKCNHSAFNGYHYTPSAWSDIACTCCFARWRTKAKYVDKLPSAPKDFYDHPANREPCLHHAVWP